MKNCKICIAVAALAVLSSPVWLNAQNDNNGFPSGPHYNLNIIGKKADYNCVPVQTDPTTGLPIYGNVIFVPETGQNIQILMTSGKGTKAAQVTELQVTDACAGFDGDAAELRLPPNPNGYRVYARALAKPSDNNSMTITPSLVAVEDEYGNDLIYLGFVDATGGFNSTGETFSRSKGKSTALDITGLFEWTGTVCTIDWTLQSTETKPVCWLDNPTEGTIGVIDPADQFFPAQPDPANPGAYLTCTDGVLTYVPVTCQAYSDEWVFNIGDFVTYLWGLDNNGLKLLQVRFYPN